MIRIPMLLCALFTASPAWADLQVPMTYLRQEVDLPPTLSNLDPLPDDLGIAGAGVGVAENATTGSFMGHSYTLEIISVPPETDVLPVAKEALAASPFLILDADADTILAIADLPEATNAVIFNVGAGNAALRDASCRRNVLHTAPSVRMRTDALMQFFVTRRWSDLVLVAGEHPGDVVYAEALKGSATKFGLLIAAEKTWAFDADMRRNASAEVPLFTQDFPDHDALLIADELHDFGRYVMYNTWLPRPIAGSEGMRAEAWAPVVEQWGAAQLQSRFQDAAGRPMRPRDWAAWAAIRTLGEAVTRTNSADPTMLYNYILGDQFELAGFKGRPLSFRPWNGQLRQPIPLAHDRALVAMAPLEGFLHQVNELDTLGLDQPESTCTAFGG